MRPLIRNIVSIANGIVPYSNEIVSDRFNYYCDIIDYVNEKLRKNQNLVE